MISIAMQYINSLLFHVYQLIATHCFDALNTLTFLNF